MARVAVVIRLHVRMAAWTVCSVAVSVAARPLMDPAPSREYHAVQLIALLCVWAERSMADGRRSDERRREIVGRAVAALAGACEVSESVAERNLLALACANTLARLVRSEDGVVRASVSLRVGDRLITVAGAPPPGRRRRSLAAEDNDVHQPALPLR